MSNYTLGSLFDGIGAVPYAASFFGIKTLWASEILPNAISVTRRHFPDMEHLGDITKLDGGKIPPVEIIAFGSPCQSWSVAGDRTGFDGKSGLFMEAVRINREMRKATNGRYPQFALFENVTGLLNCRAGGRSNYQAVLEAFCEAEIPMPKSGRWANAGMVRGRGIDFAWIVKDSQYHRTAQRRKRLFALMDFTGQCAGEILFVSKSLSGYFAARERKGQGVAAYIESRAGSEGAGINTGVAGTLDANYGKGPGMRGGIEREIILCAATGQSNAEILTNLSATLNCNCEQPIVCMADAGMSSGLNQMPCICEPAVYGICSDKSNSMLSHNKHSGIYKAETCRTLDQNCGNPACNQGGMVIVEPVMVETLPDAITMRLREGCAGGGKGPLIQNEKSGTLATGNDQYLFCIDRRQAIHPDVCGTLCASGAGLSRPAGNANETDLCVTYCLQGNMIGRQDKNGPQGNGINKEVCFTISAADKHAIATFSRQRSDLFKQEDLASTQTARQYKDATDLVCQKFAATVDCRNFSENDEISGTLQSKCTGGYSLNYQNPVRTGYIVRRLTPTEAERLMSLPDGWTEYGYDGKQMSDSARYQMCGNSIVVNCLAYIMQNIAELLKERGTEQRPPAE